MKDDLGIGEQKRSLMEKPKEFSISVSNFPETGSSSTAGSKNMQGESSPSNIASAQKETLHCSNPKSSTSASSTPSNEIACLNGTSGQSRENLVESWTHVTFSVFELIVVGCSLAALIASYIVKSIREFTILEIELRVWCVLVLVTVCGRHFIRWMMMRVKESMSSSRERASEFFQGKVRYSYYLYGLGKSFGVFLWFALVLITWFLLLDTSKLLKRQTPTAIRNFIRSNLITLVIVGALWVGKTFLVNKLSSSFQVTRNFDWIRNSLINQHILEVFDQGLKPGHDGDRSAKPTVTNCVQGWINELKIGNENEGVIYRLLNVVPEEVLAWAMEALIDRLRSNKLPSIINELVNLVDDEGFRDKLEYEDKVPELEIAADLIFEKMKRPRAKLEEEDKVVELDTAADPTSSSRQSTPPRVITKDDLESLFGKTEATAVIQQIHLKLVPGDHSGKNAIIDQALKTWLVHATVERRRLVLSINDTKSAIRELNEFVSGIVLILLIVIWSLMVGILTPEGLLLTISQLFFLTFVFGNTAKSAFEGVIFRFVKHPFDIGDLCLINREEMVVERINLLTTVFRKNNKDKVFYSNSILSTLPIRNIYWGTLPVRNIPVRNIYRGNIDIKDSLEFTIKWPVALDREIIDHLISDIKNRLCKDKNKKWFPECDLVVKELEDEKRAKMVLSVTYCNVNFHRSRATMTWRLRHELIIALNGILRDLKIEHREIRPQEVYCTRKTAKQPSAHEPNDEANDCKFGESALELNKETIIDEEE